MPSITYSHLRQSGDCLPPRPRQSLCRTINYFYYGTLRTTWGDTNVVTGNCSGILGGVNNTDSGLNDTFIAGSGIAAVNPNSLHINGLWANGIPGPGPGAALPGTVYFDNIASLPFPWNTCNVLMIV
jgi:hypothetical protein